MLEESDTLRTTGKDDQSQNTQRTHRSTAFMLTPELYDGLTVHLTVHLETWLAFYYCRLGESEVR